MAETNSLLNCRWGNLSASSNLALSANEKGNVKALPFFVRLNPVNACVHKDEDGRKSGLAQQGLFVCKDARGSEEISNLAFILSHFLYFCPRFHGERFTYEPREGNRCESCTVPAAVTLHPLRTPQTPLLVRQWEGSPEGRQVRKPAGKSA